MDVQAIWLNALPGIILIIAIYAAIIGVITRIIYLIIKFLKAKTRETELKNKLAEQQLRE